MSNEERIRGRIETPRLCPSEAAAEKEPEAYPLGTLRIRST